MLRKGEVWEMKVEIIKGEKLNKKIYDFMNKQRIKEYGKDARLFEKKYHKNTLFFFVEENKKILFDKNNVVWFLDPSFLYAPSVYQIGSFFWNYFEIIHKNIDEAINEWNKLSNEKLNKREVLLFMLPWAFLVGSFFANKKIKGDFDKYLMNLVKDSSKWIWEEIDKIDNLI